MIRNVLCNLDVITFCFLYNLAYFILQLKGMHILFRINNLVEQEVKRRLFEEKVQREKQRRIEREKEKKERQVEIEKIKLAHHREIKQLKAKLDKR